MLGAGLQPDLYCAAVGISPCGDYAALSDSCAPGMRARAVSFMGGTPTERPDLYAARSPLTHVAAVRCPVLLVCADTDAYGPLSSSVAFAEALRASGGDCEVSVRPGGHEPDSAAEAVLEMEAIALFLRRAVPAADALPPVAARPVSAQAAVEGGEQRPARTAAEREADKRLDRILARAAVRDRAPRSRPAVHSGHGVADEMM
jgi:acylaminoacyl-peptidase